MNVPVIQNQYENERVMNEIHKRILKSNSDLLIF